MYNKALTFEKVTDVCYVVYQLTSLCYINEGGRSYNLNLNG